MNGGRNNRKKINRKYEESKVQMFMKEIRVRKSPLQYFKELVVGGDHRSEFLLPQMGSNKQKWRELVAKPRILNWKRSISQEIDRIQRQIQLLGHSHDNDKHHG